ncbi:peptide deformylase [Candidatus Daviesbacteria bacterium]|nr:peptide deformylase [Candidatus Daviesbacteria bacterium]
MKTTFLKLNNPLEILNIIEKMLKIAYGQQKDNKKAVMVGLAAPQIGISKKIILVDIAANGKGKVGDLRVYINPQIIWKSKKMGEWYEGCYSTGNICGIVSRSTTIKIRAAIIKFEANQPLGLEVEEKHTGYVARIFQHEIDHLNGILFYKHIKDPDKLHLVKKSEFPLYRDKQAWKNWPKKYPYPLLI